MTELFANIAQWAVDVVYSFGYVGMTILISLSHLYLNPVPTPLILAFAGFLVEQGRFSFIMVLTTSTAGAMTVSLIFYFMGLWISEKRLRSLIRRAECSKLLFESDLDKATEQFERHGGKAILIGHLVPGIGPIISIPAGINRMPILGRFMIYSVLGCALWNGVWVILGWILGAQWMVVERYALIIEYAVLTAMVGGVLWFVWHRWKVCR